jgi:hypothetical protein
LSGASVPQQGPNLEFLGALLSSNPNYTGWPVWLDSRNFGDQTARPYLANDVWEALIASFDSGWSDHLDFWRLSPAGEFYLYRAFQDDVSVSDRHPAPMTEFQSAAGVLPQAFHELRKLNGSILQHAEKELTTTSSSGLQTIKSAAELMKNNFDILEALSNIDGMRALPRDATIDLFDLTYKTKKVLDERAAAKRMQISVNGVRAMVPGVRRDGVDSKCERRHAPTPHDSTRAEP